MQQSAWRSHLVKGSEHYQASRWEEALPHFSKAIEANPKQCKPYWSRAATYEKLGNPREALRDVQRLIALEPTNWQTYHMAGRLLMRAGKHEASRKMYGLSLEHLPPQYQKRRAEVEALLQHAQSLQCHVLKLPVELLSAVFVFVVGSSAAQPTTLSAVCRFWRQVSLSTPSVWATLVFGGRLTSRTCLKKGNDWIERARGNIRDLSLRAGTLNERNVTQGLRQLRWSRLQTLRLEDANQEGLLDLQQMVQAHGEPPLSALNHLYLSFISHGVAFLPILLNAPLRTLSMDLCLIPWSLVAEYTNGLQSLSWTRQKGGGGHSAFFDILKSNPGLQDIVLKCPDPAWQLSSAFDRLTLEHLISLHVEGSPLSHVVERVAMPHLQTLVISRFPFSATATLDHLTAAGLASLTRLEVHYTHVAAASVVDLLRQSPSLETLEITDLASQANLIAEAIAEPLPVSARRDTSDGASSPTFMCPALRHLNLSRCPDLRTGALVRMVKGRNPGLDAERNSNLAELQALLVDACPLIEAETLPWFRARVPKFSCIYNTKKAAAWKR